jgi:hypothetical protein
VRHFEEALASNAGMGARPWLAHAQADYARLLFARDAPGDMPKARLLLSQARASAQALGIQSALDVAEAAGRASSAQRRLTASTTPTARTRSSN